VSNGDPYGYSSKQNMYYCRPTLTTLTNTTSPYGFLCWVYKVVDADGTEFTGPFNYCATISCGSSYWGAAQYQNVSPYGKLSSQVIRHPSWYASSKNSSGVKPATGTCTIYYAYMVPSWQYGYTYNTTLSGSTSLPSV